jgi:hypothetical protein
MADWANDQMMNTPFEGTPGSLVPFTANANMTWQKEILSEGMQETCVMARTSRYGVASQWAAPMVVAGKKADSCLTSVMDVGLTVSRGAWTSSRDWNESNTMPCI